MEGHNPRDFVVGAIIGGVVGVTTALLLAPKAGCDLRDDLYDTYNDMSERTQDMADNVSRKGQYFARGVSSQASELADRAKDLVDALSCGVKSIKQGFEGSTKHKNARYSDHLEGLLDLASFGIDAWQKFSKRR